MTDYHLITADNIEDAQDLCIAIDQRDELAIGDETWGISYDGGQRGQMSRYAASGRGAVCVGGDSLWGDWQTLGSDAPQAWLRGQSVLVLDDGDHWVTEAGEWLMAGTGEPVVHA